MEKKSADFENRKKNKQIFENEEENQQIFENRKKRISTFLKLEKNSRFLKWKKTICSFIDNGKKTISRF